MEGLSNNIIEFSHKNKGALLFGMTPIDDPCFLTCWSRKEIKVGDVVEIRDSCNRVQKWEIIEIIERRDCWGVFENPEDKINTFYKLKIENVLKSLM
jgi:hypothetical protein